MTGRDLPSDISNDAFVPNGNRHFAVRDFTFGGGDGFSNRRPRQIRPKTGLLLRREATKFGHTREKHRQSLGASMACVGRHWFRRDGFGMVGQ